jgi:pimeloyl-ACP methyl ester carboxylesterase
MRILSEKPAEEVEGVTERLFELEVDAQRVPGVLWSPTGATGVGPLILMGHGGSWHKKAPTLVARAYRYVTAHGFAVAAIDAPGHGDRVTAEEAATTRAEITERIATRRRLGGEALRRMMERSVRAVPEWQSTLDGLLALDVIAPHAKIGYWGVSMGTIIGVPFVAAEPRISAAVLGLAGLAPGDERMAKAAAAIRIPVEFVFQWDDELATREAGLAMYDAFTSEEKSLHVNPGGHVERPAFEEASQEAFFLRHLRG